MTERCPKCGSVLKIAGQLRFCPDEQRCGWTVRMHTYSSFHEGKLTLLQMLDVASCEKTDTRTLELLCKKAAKEIRRLNTAKERR